MRLSEHWSARVRVASTLYSRCRFSTPMRSPLRSGRARSFRCTCRSTAPGVMASCRPGLTRPFGVIYAGAPGKKGLDIAIEAWRLAGIQHPLVVTGIERREARKYVGNDPPKEIVFGGVPRATHREIIRQSAVYVSASRREEYGTTQLEALADGVPLVAVPSRGLSEAVAIARRLRPDLVAKAISPLSLAERVRTVFQLTTAELARYRADAASLMEQYSYRRSNSVSRTTSSRFSSADQPRASHEVGRLSRCGDTAAAR